MLDFPDAPTPDQVFDATPFKRFIWRGDRWRRGLLPLTLTSLDPATTGANGGPITITYIGTGFDYTCVAYEDGQAIPAVPVSPTEMHVTHTPTGFIGTTQCHVRRGADTSATLPFEYVNSGSNPDISSFNPTSVSSLTTTVTTVDCVGLSGAGEESFYSPDAVVVMDGRDMPTSFKSIGLLEFEVTGSDWAPGEYQVIVRQLGGVSDPSMPFTIG